MFSKLIGNCKTLTPLTDGLDQICGFIFIRWGYMGVVSEAVLSFAVSSNAVASKAVLSNAVASIAVLSFAIFSIAVASNADATKMPLHHLPL